MRVKVSSALSGFVATLLGCAVGTLSVLSALFEGKVPVSVSLFAEEESDFLVLLLSSSSRVTVVLVIRVSVLAISTFLLQLTARLERDEALDKAFVNLKKNSCPYVIALILILVVVVDSLVLSSLTTL